MANWKKLLILMILLLAAGAVAMSLLFGTLFGGVPLGKPARIDTSFATTASVRCYYNRKVINKAVTNANDLKALKRLLAGFAWGNDALDKPGCMFDPDVSVTLSGGGKSITFCPAFCCDDLVEIGTSGKYLHMTHGRRDALNRICKKYGLDFDDL